MYIITYAADSTVSRPNCMKKRVSIGILTERGEKLPPNNNDRWFVSDRPGSGQGQRGDRQAGGGGGARRRRGQSAEGGSPGARSSRR